MLSPALQVFVQELVARQPRVVWLAGSHARGEPAPYSDVDLGIIADAPAAPLRTVVDGHLVSVVTTTEEATRQSFRAPAFLGAAVPGWRRAVLLHDPDGVGARLRSEAERWDWSAVAAACDRWVAAQLAFLAEEVHKLLNALARGNEVEAVYRRNQLAMRLPLVVSVHQRILYDTESALPALVGAALGAHWAAAHRGAIGADGADLDSSIACALELFAAATHLAFGALDQDEAAVVRHTLAVISASGRAMPR